MRRQVEHLKADFAEVKSDTKGVMVQTMEMERLKFALAEKMLEEYGKNK